MGLTQKPCRKTAFSAGVTILLLLMPSCSSRKYTKNVDIEKIDRKWEIVAPLKVTAGNESNFLPDLSPNGQYVIYTSDIGGNKDLFEKKATGGFGRRLTTHPADDFSGAMSPDGTKVAFVSRRDDATGDIQILDLGFSWFSTGSAAGEKPSKTVSLPRSEDFRPFWFPDSKRVVFSSRVAGDKESSLMFVDIANRIPQPLFDLKGDQPTVSRDSRYLAFVKRGSLQLFDMKEERLWQLTDGVGVQDGYPAFSPDGASLYFVRYADDTDRNGQMDAMDKGSLWELQIAHILQQGNGEDFYLRPVTAASYSQFSPQLRPPYLYFAMQVESSLDIFRVPLPGQVALEGASVEDVKSVARQTRSPEERLLVLRSGAATLSRNGQSDAAAEIVLEELRTQTDAGHPAEALWLREKIRRNYEKQTRVQLIADVRVLEMRLISGISRQDNSEQTEDEKAELSALEKDLSELQTRIPKDDPVISGIAGMLHGRILLKKKEFVRAHKLFSEISESLNSEGEIAAEADLYKSIVTRFMSDEDSALLSLVEVLRKHRRVPDLPLKASVAALSLASEVPTKESERLLRIRDAAAGLPVMSAQAHVRIADMFAESGKKAVAENELRQIVDGYPESPEIVLKAAEKLLKNVEASGRYDVAEEIFEALKKSIDPMNRREGRQIEALKVGFHVRRGEALLRSGEPGMAIKEYRKAAEIWPLDLSSQRGIIDGLHRRKNLSEALAATEKSLSKNQVTAEALYLHGYARTYLIDAAVTPGDKLVEIDRCIKTVEAAREVNGQLLHIHQTLGWLYQQKGYWLTEYRKKGFAGKFSEKTAQVKGLFGSSEPNWLEMAVDSYLTANYLSQPESLERANLSQNLAQTYYELGNYQKALAFYMRRLQVVDRIPIRDPQTEALLWRNAGRAAFGVEELGLAAHLQRKALTAYEKIGPSEDVAYSLDALALTLSEQKQYQEALDVYQRLRESHQRSGHKLNEFGAIVNQGFVAFQAGFDQRALEYLGEAEKFSVSDTAEEKSAKDSGAIKLDVAGQGSAAQGFSIEEKKSMIAAFRSQIYQRSGRMLLALEANLERKRILSDMGNREETNSNGEALAILLNNIGEQQKQLGLLNESAKTFHEVAEIAAAKRSGSGRQVGRDEWLNSLNFLRVCLNMAALGQLEDRQRFEAIDYATRFIDELTAARRQGQAIDESVLAKYFALRAALSAGGGVSSDETGQNDLARVLDISESIGSKEPAVLSAALNYMATLPEPPARDKVVAGALLASRETVFMDQRSESRIWKYLYARGFGEEALAALHSFANKGGVLSSPADRRSHETIAVEVVEQKVKQGLLNDAAIVAEKYANARTLEIMNRLLKNRPTDGRVARESIVQKTLREQKERLDVAKLDVGDVILTFFRMSEGRAVVKVQNNIEQQVLVLNTPPASLVDGLLNDAKAKKILSKSESVYLVDINGTGMSGVSGSKEWNDLFRSDSAKNAGISGISVSFVPAGAIAIVAKSLARLPKGSIGVVGLSESNESSEVFGKPGSGRIVRKFQLKGHDAVAALKMAAESSDIVHMDVPFLMLPLAAQHIDLAPMGTVGTAGAPLQAGFIRVSAPIWQLSEVGPARASLLITKIEFPEGPKNEWPHFNEAASALLLAAMNGGFSSLILGEASVGPEAEKAASVGHWAEFYKNLGEEPLGLVGGRNNLLVLGHPGFSKAREEEYASKNLMRYVDEADDFWDNDDAKAAAAKYAEALYLARKSANKAEVKSLLNKLVGAHYSLLDYDGALMYQEELASRASEVGATKEIGEAFLGVAVLAVRAGKFDKSDEALKVAEENLLKSGAVADVAKVWHYRGIAAEGRQEYEKTISCFQQARDLYLKAGKPKLAGQFYVDIGTVYKEKLSNFPLALEFYEKARDDLEKLEDQDALLNLQIERANTLLAMGDVKWAIGVLEKHVIGRMKAEEKPVIWVRGSQILAKAYFWAGMFQEARDQLKKTNDGIKLVENERVQAGLIIDALSLDGMLKAKLDGYDVASGAFQQSAEMSKKHRFKDKESIAYSNLGFWAREYGQTEVSLRFFNMALALDRELKSKSDMAFDQRNLGLSYILTGDFDRAETLLTEALKASEELGLAYNAIYSRFGLGDIAIRQKKWDLAAAEFKKALLGAEKSFFQDFMWKAHAGIASAEAAKENWKNAAESLEKAVGIIEKLRAGLKSESSRTGFQSDRGVQAVYGDYVRALTKLGKTEEAWVVAERSRARAFIDSIGNQRLKFPKKGAESLLDTDRRLASEIEIAERKKFIGGKEAEKAEAELQELKSQRSGNFEEIRKTDPQLAQLVRVEAISLKELYSSLPSDMALLEYMVTDSEIYIWLVQSGGIRTYTVPHKASVTEELIEGYRSLLQSFSSVDYSGKKLSELLLAPVADELVRVKRLTVVPHGPLHYLSFASLPLKGKYLLDYMPISYLESATFVRFLRDDVNIAGNGTRVLAFGNPERGSLLDLPFAEKEAQSIARFYPGTKVLLKRHASKQAYRSHAGASDIIHIAAHGEFNHLAPAESRLLLSKDGDSDGNMTLADIFAQSLSASIVSLSACETGLGKVSTGDEVVGMNRAFFFAGAGSIISSLWRISDVASAVVMKRFYRNIAEGMPKDLALQKAQLLARSYYAHPAYWTAFRLLGNPR